MHSSSASSSSAPHGAHQPETPGMGGWPKVLGILGIVAASWGVLNALAGLLMGSAMETVAGRVPEHLKAEVSIALSRMKDFTNVQSTGMIILGVMLFIASLRLIRRRRSSRVLLLTWAGVRIAFAAAIFPMLRDYMQLTAATLLKIRAATAENADTAEIRQLAETASITGITLTGCLLPAFMIVWFSRREIRERMQTWLR